MKITALFLNHFRSYAREEVALSEGINIFAGDNAQGKTNLLEAVCLLSVGRSPRTPRDKELIMWENARAKVMASVKKDYGSDEVEIVLDKSENKRIAINGMPVSKVGELMGVVSTVFFSPDEMRIVKEAPSDRRRFMNMALCQMSKPYFYLLARYNRILSQRNKLLKSGRATPDSLDVWDMQLAEAGSKLIKSRRGFTAELAPLAKDAHEYLTDGKESLVAVYEGVEGATAAEIAENFLAALKDDREKDLKQGFTHSGVQKDDLGLYLSGADVRTFGSQGQQRTAALALKIAELELIAKQTGERPILLLDDVLSELDKRRQEKLLSRVKSGQVILTCTHLDEELKKNLEGASYFQVKKGSAKRV